jgi:hypothetical protein
MSTSAGKIQLLGTAEVHGEKVMVLRFLQGRNPNWVGRPFFAKYDPDAIWLDQLKPAFGEERFFFEDELTAMLQPKQGLGQVAPSAVNQFYQEVVE